MSSISFFLTAVLIFGSSPILIFSISRYVRQMAFAEAEVPRNLSWIVPIVLVVWFLSANIVGYSASLPARLLVSPIAALEIAIPMVLIISMLLLSPVAARVLERVRPDRLVGVQVYRIEGLLFLFLYFHDQFLSKGFALAAGGGDFLVGVGAILVSGWVRKKRRGYMAAVVLWNILGITDLVTAPISAILSGAQGVTSYPLVLVPLFLGPPLGISLHVASLRNVYLISREGRGRRQAMA